MKNIRKNIADLVVFHLRPRVFFMSSPKVSREVFRAVHTGTRLPDIAVPVQEEIKRTQ